MQYTWRGYNLVQENYKGFNFKIDISQNTKCDNLVGFPKSGLILIWRIRYSDNLLCL